VAESIGNARLESAATSFARYPSSLTHTSFFSLLVLFHLSERKFFYVGTQRRTPSVGEALQCTHNSLFYESSLPLKSFFLHAQRQASRG